MAVAMTLRQAGAWPEQTPAPEFAGSPVSPHRAGVAHRQLVLRRRRLVAVSVLATVAATFGAVVATVVISALLTAGPSVPGGGPLTAAGSSGPAARTVAARNWVVRPGDTLWTIVEHSGLRGDPRPLVDRLNAELHARPLQVGERIALP